MTELIGLGIWIVCACMAAKIAQDKGYSGVAVAAIGGLIGLLIVLLLPKRGGRRRGQACTTLSLNDPPQ
jgi:hypothetical protein